MRFSNSNECENEKLLGYRRTVSIKTLLAITERPAKIAIIIIELAVSAYRNASGSKSNETSKWLARIRIKPIVEGVTSASGSDV